MVASVMGGMDGGEEGGGEGMRSPNRLADRTSHLFAEGVSLEAPA